MEGLDSSTIELIGAFLTGVVGPVAYYFIGRVFFDRKQKDKDIIRESIEETAIIERELEVIKEMIGADRVWVAQFHNGGTFYPTGRSIQKFSIFYESVSPGISNIGHSMNNIPCSLYSKAVSKLLDHKGLHIPSFTDERTNTYGVRSMTELTGSASMYILPLFSLNDKFIGMVGLDFVKEERELTDEELSTFNLHTGRIAGYLSNFLAKE